MAACRDIITTSLRKIGVLRAGGEASAADAADALSSLKSFYMERITAGTFGRVWNIPISVGGEVTPRGNDHINILTADAVTVDPPSLVPYDYWRTWMPCRDYGWGLNVPLGGDDGFNVPRDKAPLIITNEFTEERVTYLYDGTIQRWMRIDNLALTDEAPLSARGADGLASVLAMRLTELFGSELAGPMTMQSANRYLTALATNYGNGDNEYGC